MSWYRQVTEGLRAAARAFSDPHLRRLEIAWALSVTADLAGTVALGVFAYEVGGAAAVGFAALLRLLPSALAAPFMALPGDRFPRERVLTVVELVRGILVIGAGAAALAGAPAIVVYLLMGLAAVVSSALRSVQFALLPALTTDPEALVAANVGLASIEGLGTLVGPAIGGLLLATWGAPETIAVSGATFVVASAILFFVRSSVRFARAERSGRPSREVFEGVREIARDPSPRSIVGLFFAQTFVRGALGVLVVVLAIEILGLGTEGVGYLFAAFGIGALVGGLATLALVGRPQLARWFGVGLVLWGIPIIVLGGTGVALAAFLAMAVIGVGNNLVDVAGMTLLQRTVEDRVLARVLGALDGIVLAGAAAGAAISPLLIDTIGVRWAAASVGLALLVVVAFAQPGLRRLDRIAVVPARSLALLRQVPMFTALDLPTIDHLALVARPIRIGEGEVLMRQGEPGDLFYVIDTGSLEVSISGHVVAILVPGDHVGEIALLRNVPRTATVTAREDGELLALERDDFLRAVTGFALSTAEAERIADARLAELPAARPDDTRR
jgi:MFS family permease